MKIKLADWTSVAEILFNTMMTLNENRYQMSKSGYLEYPEGTLQGVIDLKIYAAWKKSPGGPEHIPQNFWSSWTECGIEAIQNDHSWPKAAIARIGMRGHF